MLLERAPTLPSRDPMLFHERYGHKITMQRTKMRPPRSPALRCGACLRLFVICVCCFVLLFCARPTEMAHLHAVRATEQLIARSRRAIEPLVAASKSIGAVVLNEHIPRH